MFETVGLEHDVFFLWQNDNTVVVGKNQNTASQVNQKYIDENGIIVVRRLSGGGAVFHDMGNINFTFITSAGNDTTLQHFCKPVVECLEWLGVTAVVGGRNDILIDGKKISGNAQYIKNGRILHHGTILFDSDLDKAQKALNVSGMKIKSKGVDSVKSRITNVSEHLKTQMLVSEFMEKLKHSILGDCGSNPSTMDGEKAAMTDRFLEIILNQTDEATIKEISKNRYEQWDWNYGMSPRYSLFKEQYIENCGNIEIYMDIKNGKIEDIQFFGDYFFESETKQLVEILKNCKLEAESIKNALQNVNIDDYFKNLSEDDFVKILCF